MAYEPLPTSSKVYEEAATSSDGELEDGPSHSLLRGNHLGSGGLSKPKPWVKRISFVLVSVLLNLVLFVTSSVLLATRYYEKHLVLNPELRRTSTYCPIHDLIDLGLHTTTINGSFFPSKHPSVARKMPNPVSDAVWADWEHVKPIPITKEQIVRMGKDPSTAVKLEDKDFGLGDDAYVGSLDVFHRLHCLYNRRQIAYGEYYNKLMVNPYGVSLRAYHVNHCVDLLMQALQCSGNVNFITWHWVESKPYPFPDMSTNRKSIAFDRLAAWQDSSSVDMDKYTQIMTQKPEGVKERPAPDALYKYHNLPSPNYVGGANPGNDFNF